MKAFILCGGLGKRLRSIVKDRPKSMAIFNGKPFLEYQIEFLRKNGVNEVVLCTGYMDGVIREYFGDGKKFGVSVKYSHETTELGTAGAIKNAERFVKGTFIVINGDSFIDLDLRKMIEFHKKNKAVATGSFKKMQDPSRYGTVTMDEKNVVGEFLEKKEGAGPGIINIGLYIFEPSVLGYIEKGKKTSLENDVFPKLLKTGCFFGYVCDCTFIDIGVPEDYNKFMEVCLRGNSKTTPEKRA